MSSGLRDYGFTAMGSPGLIRLYSPERRQADAAAAAAMNEIARIENRYSRFLPDSVLSGLNRVGRAGGAIEVDAETAGIVDYAFSCHRKSGGLFDITAGCLRQAWDFSVPRLPDRRTVEELLRRVGLDKLDWRSPRLTFTQPGMELDFGGICKEYAVDRAAETCLSHGLDHGLIDLGGDIRVLGPQADGAPWPIGVRHPRMPGSLAASLMLGGGGMATSGDYERFIEVDGTRYCHILDPRSGWPISGLSSVTVLAGSCLLAGSVATIAMLKGRDGADWLRGLNVTHLWIDAEGRQGGNVPPPEGATPGY